MKFIDKVVCLCLDKRISFFDEIEKRVPECQLFLAGDGQLVKNVAYNHVDTPELPPMLPYSIVYPSWNKKPNAYNAWKCHRKIMQQAVDENVGNLLILEDDVFLEDDFDEIYAKVEKFFTDYYYDMIYFGHYSEHARTKPIAENIIRLYGSGGWHGVLIKKKVMEVLLRFEPIGPYDWICGQFLHENMGCYGVTPCIISQKDNEFSYVEGSVLKKPDRFQRGKWNESYVHAQ